jgi:tryptophanase
MWFLARPLGMMQLRGAMIAAWNDMLPHIPDEQFAANMATVAAAMAEGGGQAVGAGPTVTPQPTTPPRATAQRRADLARRALGCTHWLRTHGAADGGRPVST